MRKTKEKVSNIGKILGKIKTLRRRWRGYAEMLHQLSTAYPHNSLTYPQPIHTLSTSYSTLYLPWPIMLTAGSLNIHMYIQQSLHSLLTQLPLCVYTILMNIYTVSSLVQYTCCRLYTVLMYLHTHFGVI